MYKRTRKEAKRCECTKREKDIQVRLLLTWSVVKIEIQAIEQEQKYPRIKTKTSDDSIYEKGREGTRVAASISRFEDLAWSRASFRCFRESFDARASAGLNGFPEPFARGMRERFVEQRGESRATTRLRSSEKRQEKNKESEYSLRLCGCFEEFRQRNKAITREVLMLSKCKAVFM